MRLVHEEMEPNPSRAHAESAHTTDNNTIEMNNTKKGLNESDYFTGLNDTKRVLNEIDYNIDEFYDQVEQSGESNEHNKKSLKHHEMPRVGKNLKKIYMGSIKIISPSYNDEGYYQCRASNKNGVAVSDLVEVRMACEFEKFLPKFINLNLSKSTDKIIKTHRSELFLSF